MRPEGFALCGEPLEQGGRGGHRQPKTVAGAERIRLARGVDEADHMRFLLDRLAGVVAPRVARDLLGADDDADGRGTGQ